MCGSKQVGDLTSSEGKHLNQNVSTCVGISAGSLEIAIKVPQCCLKTETIPTPTQLIIDTTLEICRVEKLTASKFGAKKAARDGKKNIYGISTSTGVT